MNTTTNSRNPTSPSYPTQQYATADTTTTTTTRTAPTNKTNQQQQVKPSSTSINTLVPLDIEDQDQDQDPVGNSYRRNRNRNKPREFGLKALRNHLFVFILRCVLTLLSLSVLAYVAWLSQQWVEEKKAVDDEDSYVLGFVGVSSICPSLFLSIPAVVQMLTNIPRMKSPA